MCIYKIYKEWIWQAFEVSCSHQHGFLDSLMLTFVTYNQKITLLER